MADSVDTDQTAPIGAVCSGSMLFASLLNLAVMLGNYLQHTTYSRRHFQMDFFLGALRVNLKKKQKIIHDSLSAVYLSSCHTPVYLPRTSLTGTGTMNS